MKTLPLLRAMLAARLPNPASDWLATTSAQIADFEDVGRFCASISAASRYVPRGLLEPTADELRRAEQALPGWNPERWTLRETVRIVLVLSRTDLDTDDGSDAVLEAFRYADEGELCALYRSLAHLPGPERFLWRATEGCRTNMLTVFEADVCDTPYPAANFDDVAWNQAVIKAVFIGAPVWRIEGLDRRLSPELARIALDLVEERRSAGRAIQPDLWLCLGEHAGERGLEALEVELATGTDPAGRAAAAYGLMRSGQAERLAVLLSEEQDQRVAEAMRDAHGGHTDQGAFRALENITAEV